MRYLGVRLDTRLSFVEHVSAVVAGSKKAAAALARLMPNVGGPSQSKRSLLKSVVHSRLLYGAVIWSERVLETQKATGDMERGGQKKEEKAHHNTDIFNVLSQTTSTGRKQQDFVVAAESPRRWR